MENWYSDNPLMSLELQLKSTELEMKRGYISRDELAAYNYLSKKMYWDHVMGNNSEQANELRTKRYKATTKNELRELFKEMNLLEELDELLKLTWLEISRKEYDYFLTHYTDFKAKGKKEEQMHDEMIEELINKKKT